MLFVLLNWAVILVTAFAIGFAVLRGVNRAFGYQVKRPAAFIYTGLIAATTYAQIVSLFYRVNWEALGVWSALAICSILIWHKAMRESLKSAWNQIGTVQKVVIAILALLVLFFVSRGYYLLDTNLYHAQCVRWLEEYGALKGLGNLQSRASYNSSFFCLTALYSMKYVFGQSMHTMQGLMALILAVECTGIGKILTRKTVLLSDFARIAGIYYLTLLYQQIISPSSDYAVMITLFLIVIRWLSLLEQEEESPVPYALLCMAGAYTVTLKLTAGLILLLAIKPILQFAGKKNVRAIVISFVTGIVIVLPFLIRNVIISGWLLYPSTAIDLFDVDWKVPKVVADADAFQIKSWGKGIHAEGIDANNPFSWFANWFATILTGTEKFLVILDFCAVLVVLVMCLVTLYRVLRRQKQDLYKRFDKILVMLMLTVSFLFWQFSAPLPRYGYAYILLLLAVVFGDLLIRFFTRGARLQKAGYCGILIFLAVLLLWKGAVLARGVWVERVLGYYVTQTDYETNEGDPSVTEHEINGITFYAHIYGYHKLPGGGITFTMRGNSIRDGFRFEDKNEGMLNLK